MTDRISPAAAAAREHARHATGEFGVQRHTPPETARQDAAGEVSFELVGPPRTSPAGEEVRQMRATRDVPGHGIRAGDLGGWLASSHLPDGTPRVAPGAWVDRGATVIDDAVVADRARVAGDAIVSGSARVAGDALVADSTMMTGDAVIDGDAELRGHARMGGRARISGRGRMAGRGTIDGDAVIDGDAWVGGRHRIGGSTRITGDARLYGAARLVDAGTIDSGDWRDGAPMQEQGGD